jgi:hypothetical protein
MLIFILFGLAVTGYFALRGIRLAVISGFTFYLRAEVIEYALPTLLIFAQSFVVELSGIDNTWKSFLALGLVIAAFAVNTVGQQQRKKWERNARESFSDRWGEWLGKLEQAGIIAPVDRLFRYTSVDQCHPGGKR